MTKYRYGWIEISYNLFELHFLLLSVYAVLFYSAVFEMCGLRTDTYGWIEISYNLFELDFLLLSVYAVLFYPAVFEMCGLRTDKRRPHISKTAG